MYEQSNVGLCNEMVVAESALLKRVLKNRFGTVPGLDEDELAEPIELEKMVFLQEFGPILALPVADKKFYSRGSKGENGRLDWGAFGTVDFERKYPFNKSLYKAGKLREQLKDILILFSIVNERIKPMAKYLVLKYLKMGIIEFDHIVDDDMKALARLNLRVERLRKEIAQL